MRPLLLTPLLSSVCLASYHGCACMLIQRLHDAGVATPHCGKLPPVVVGYFLYIYIYIIDTFESTIYFHMWSHTRQLLKTYMHNQW
jgi:hypothetical protein